MTSRKLRISLKIRIFMIFFGILAATVLIFILSFYRFVSKNTFENLDKEYLSMVNDLNDTSQNLLWKLTLTSQQLLENETVQKAIVSYQEADNPYRKQTYYSDLLDQVSSLTMSETDIALFFFSDPLKEEIIYSSLPLGRPKTVQDCLYQNELFQYIGPASSQSSFVGNPVFILNRTVVLPNGNPIFFSMESGYYSLDRQFQALQSKSAYVIFTNEQGKILYSSIPSTKQADLDIDSVLSSADHNFRIFSQQASQGWSTYIVVPQTVYTSQYKDGLREFTKYTFLFAILLIFLAFLFWQSIYHPLQLFDRQLETIVTNQEISGENPSSIPEFDFLFQKIKLLQQQVQEMLAQAVIQEKENTKAQLEKLRAQINPHFLMNTLNTLHWLALMNQQKEIDEITQSLAHLLSYNLDKDSYHTTLQKELNAVSEYVRLQKVRYEFRFEIQVLPENTVLNYPCPKFILQPFIENSLSHGYKKDMEITVQIQILEECIEIRISDTGLGMTQAQQDSVRLQLQTPSRQAGTEALPSLRTENASVAEFSIIMNQSSGKGIGLSYVAGILAFYYGCSCPVEVTSLPDRGTAFCIRLPKMKGRGYHAENTDHR